MARGRTHRAKAAIGWLITLLRDPAVRRGLWALVFFAAAATVFASVSLPRDVNLRAGQVAYTLPLTTPAAGVPAGGWVPRSPCSPIPRAQPP